MGFALLSPSYAGSSALTICPLSPRRPVFEPVAPQFRTIELPLRRDIAPVQASPPGCIGARTVVLQRGEMELVPWAADAAQLAVGTQRNSVGRRRGSIPSQPAQRFGFR